MFFTKNYATKKRMKNRHIVGEISAKQKPVNQNLVFKPQKNQNQFLSKNWLTKPVWLIR